MSPWPFGSFLRPVGLAVSIACMWLRPLVKDAADVTGKGLRTSLDRKWPFYFLPLLKALLLPLEVSISRFAIRPLASKTNSGKVGQGQIEVGVGMGQGASTWFKTYEKYEIRRMSKLMQKMAKPKPTVYVIAGPNGAGKTTFATEFLPGFVQCREFLNADLIAAGLSPFAPETQNVRAGRLLLERIRQLASGQADFGFETTLSGRSYVKLIGDMKAQGYRVILFFLWLPTADMALARVENRVKQGGHNVPEEDIRRRYIAGVRNLFRLYRPSCDGWLLYDASRLPPKLIASEERRHLTVKQKKLYRLIEKQAEESHEEET